MKSLFFLWLALSGSADLPWQDLTFTIFPDPGVSSDTATLCRVRVVNNGSHTWRGDRIRFEAQALQGGTVVDRARGRFGLSLGPHEALETVIGFVGRYDRFSVHPLAKDSDRGEDSRRSRHSAGHKRGKRKG
jgi:hypothetical protein